MATNGVNLIGTSTVSRSMGGTGVAFYSHATEAIGKNVALMGDLDKKDEFQLDMTYFRAFVTSSVRDDNPLNTTPSNGHAEVSDSQNMPDTNFLPTMSYATRIDDQTVFGFAMIGAAGMAANFKGDYGHRQLKSSMMLMKLVPAISYRQGNTTFGFAPVLGLGSMSLNYDDNYRQSDGTVYPNGTKPQSNREGLFGTNVGGSDLIPALGFTLGMDVKVTKKFRIGMSYNSALKYTYKDVANFSQFGPNGMVSMADEYTNGALQNYRNSNIDGNNFGNGSQTLAEYLNSDFGIPLDVGNALTALMPKGLVGSALDKTDPQNLDDLTLEQPWEIAVGVSYEVTKKMTLTADYRYVAWGLAEGYKDFGWQNQQVIALGMEFKAKKYSYRFGYNYAESPISQITGEKGALLTNVEGHYIFDQALSMLNMVGFPAIATTHFTAGFGRDLTDDLHLDVGMVYAPKVTHSRSGSLLPADYIVSNLSFFNYKYETSMEQISLSMGLNYKF